MSERGGKKKEEILVAVRPLREKRKHTIHRINALKYNTTELFLSLSQSPFDILCFLAFLFC